MAKKYDTAVVPMVIQRFNQRPAFHPQWGYALEEGWEPVGTTHQVEALEESGEQILIVYGLLKREPSPIIQPPLALALPGRGEG